jgi:hypothetical protein
MMKSFRIFALSASALLICVLLSACGGGGSTPPPTPTAPTITSTVITQATVNVPYSFYMQASGGSGSYTWAITSGSMPPGLSFNDTTAQISGTPTTPGNYPFTMKVTDSNNLSGSANLTLTVGGAILIDCNSCASGTSHLPAGNPGVPYSATLSATGGIGPYSWCIVESNGSCDNGSGGGLPPGLSIGASTGIISGTPTNPGIPTTFTVQVTDSETIPATAQTSLTVTIIGVGTTTLADGTLYSPYTASVVAVGGLGPYTWTITSGQLPPGLSLASGSCINSRSPSCEITGTPTQPGTSQFTVQVSDGETPPAVASAPLQIIVNGAGPGTLKGNYAFSFMGYNGSNSSHVLMAGAFNADGAGNITGGELDLNDGTGETNVRCGGANGPQQQLITTGSTYSIQPNGTGTMTIVTNAATYNFTIAVRSDGSGTLIQDNTDPATRGSGTIAVQATGVTLSDIEGNFALGITGSDPGGERYVAAGRYNLDDGNGDLSCTGGCILDTNDGGSASRHTFAGTLSTTVDSYGRGCFVNLTFDHIANVFYLYAYYIVSNNELLVISTDPIGGTNNANMTLWTTTRQQVSASGFNNQTLATPTVLELSAQDPNGGDPVSDVTAGLFVGQGTSSNNCSNGQPQAATFTYDENQGGTLNQQQTMQGLYCVDSTTGRVTLSGFNGIWGSPLTPPVFYLGGSAPGYAVGTDSGATSGNIEEQQQLIGGASFTNAAVDGGYWGGTSMPAISAVTDSVALLFADGIGDLTGTQYSSGPGGPGGPTNLSLTYQMGTTGRAVVQQGSNTYGFLYVVSPTKFVLLPAGTTPALNIFASVPGS